MAGMPAGDGSAHRGAVRAREPRGGREHLTESRSFAQGEEEETHPQLGSMTWADVIVPGHLCWDLKGS